MAIYRIMATMQDADGLSKDRYVNTYYVASPTPLTDEIAQLSSVNVAVSSFYMGIAQYLGEVVQSGAAQPHSVKAYDMTLPPHSRLPLAAVPFGIATSGVGTLPNEVAVCVTLEASPVAGVAPQSTRGRVYIGPLADLDAPTPITSAQSRPAPAFLTALRSNMVTMMNAITAVQPSLHLVIASQTQKKAKLGIGLRQAYEVMAVSVDDSWDTQRSRKSLPTHRDRTVVNAGVGFEFSW